MRIQQCLIIVLNFITLCLCNNKSIWVCKMRSQKQVHAWRMFLFFDVQMRTQYPKQMSYWTNVIRHESWICSHIWAWFSKEVSYMKEGWARAHHWFKVRLCCWWVRIKSLSMEYAIVYHQEPGVLSKFKNTFRASTSLEALSTMILCDLQQKIM